MPSQFIKDLITLPGFLIYGERKEGERWIFELSLPPHCPICSTCFGRTIKISSKRKQWIHGYTNTVGLFWIELPIERRRCQACFLTFTVSYPGFPSHSIATESFQHWVAQLCIGKTIQEVARLLQLAYTTVERWFYPYASALLPISNPTLVCVDEFAFRKGHDYGAAVMGTQTRNVLSMASGKNEEAIVETLQPVASKVKDVVSDLAPAMRKAIEKVCPKVIPVLDHFHVIQLFTDDSPMHWNGVANPLPKAEPNMEAFAACADC
ncbi:transposase [Geobacillus subterraneus]